MVFVHVECPECEGSDVVKYGKQANGTQRYRCDNPDCARRTFILNYQNKGASAAVKQQVIDMAMNGSGIRDTARVLGISPSTVIDVLKKRP
jgi:transposase-like protein